MARVSGERVDEHADAGAERATLSRDQIVETAISLVDSEGVGALSMRRLGGLMGVEAMALYRYVDGREDLLDAMVDSVTAPVESVAAGPADTRWGGWRGYLWRLAHHMRALATKHPNIFPLIATRHPAAPWLRPPLRNLEMVEEFLDTLLNSGFNQQQAAIVYRNFASFLLGHLLLTAAQEANSGQIHEPHPSGEDLGDYPRIQAMEDLLSEPGTDAEEFAESLENMLETVAANVGEPSASSNASQE